MLVQDFDAARDRKSYQTKCLLYAGDHPACRMVERTSPVPLTKDDLYLVTKGSSWVSLFPFVSIHYCPRCHLRETYYVDAFGKNGPAKLKSFEWGHVAHDQLITEELTNWLS